MRKQLQKIKNWVLMAPVPVQEAKPLSREEARTLLWRYILGPDRRTLMFFTWELKMPLSSKENHELVEEFLDRLERIGLVK